MADVLAELSDALAAAVASAGDSVARVEARDRIPASGIVWSADGVIVTADHVVERDDRITVGVGGDSVPATLVGRDRATDIAVLRAELTGLKPMAWAEPDALRVGHVTLAIGRPGKSVRATMGILPSLASMSSSKVARSSSGSASLVTSGNLAMPHSDPDAPAHGWSTPAIMA